MLEPRDAHSYDRIIEVLKNGFPARNHWRVMNTDLLATLTSELASCPSIRVAANSRKKGVRWISGDRIEVRLSSSLLKACIDKTGMWVTSSNDDRQFVTCFGQCVVEKTRIELASSGDMTVEPIFSPIVFIIHPTKLTAQMWHIDLIHGRQFVMNITAGPETEVRTVPNTHGSLDCLCDVIGMPHFYSSPQQHATRGVKNSRVQSTLYSQTEKTKPNTVVRPKKRTQYPGAGGSGRTLSGRVQKVRQETLPRGPQQHISKTKT